MKRLFVLLLTFLMLSASCLTESAQPSRTLDRVVVLSRHNIRSPLSGGGSVIGEITPHTWFAWTSRPSELSLRGGMAETLKGFSRKTVSPRKTRCASMPTPSSAP